MKILHFWFVDMQNGNLRYATSWICKKKLHLSLDLNLPHFITIIWKSNTTNLQDFYLLLADLEALEVLFQEAFKGQVSDFLL